MSRPRATRADRGKRIALSQCVGHCPPPRILFAYFHHLYMDFAQPTWIQKFGQICSYLLSVPAGVVSIFGTLLLVYASKMRWTLASDVVLLGNYGMGSRRHRCGD